MRDDEIYAKVKHGVEDGVINTEREKERVIMLCKEFNIQFGKVRTSVENHIRMFLLWSIVRGSGNRIMYRGRKNPPRSSGEVLGEYVTLCILLCNDLFSQRSQGII